MGRKLQDYRKWFELLSRTIEELNNFPPGGDLYAFIGGTLIHLAPEDTIILVNTFDESTKTITVHAVEGLGTRLPDIEALLCCRLNGLTFSVPDHILPDMLNGECNEIPGGITDLTFGGLPDEACKQIEEMPFFGKVYSAGISWKGRLNGTATFILPPGKELENHDLITFFIRQVAGFLSRREAEAAQKESEQFTREIINNAKEGIIVYDREFNYLVWNPFMESITGVSASEARGKNALELFPHLRKHNVDILLKRALSGETVRSPDIPYRIPQTKKSGWVSSIFRPHLNGRGEIIGVIGNIRDITERKRTEEALRASESYLRSTLHGSPVMQFALNKNHQVVSWNIAIEEYSGIKEAEILGTTQQWKAFYEEKRPVLADIMIDGATKNLPAFYKDKVKKSLYVEGAFEVTDFFPKMGTQGVWLHSTAAPIRDNNGTIIGAVETLEDITERKLAEDEVKQTRQNFETFFDTIDEFLFVLDDRGCILHCNETVTRRLGYTKEELLGQAEMMVHQPERRDEAERIMKDVLAGTMDSCPLPLVTRDGHLVPVETRVIKGEWSRRPVLFCISKDLSELKISEEKFSAAFHSSGALMAISTQHDGRFIDVNERFLESLGFSREEVIGKPVHERDLFMNPEDRVNALRMLAENGEVRNLEVPVNTKDGSLQFGLFSVEKIMIGGVPSLLTTMVDVTEQKILEKEMEFHEQEIMRFSNSLDSAIRKLNLLSSITRHDINNQLTVLMGYLEILEMTLPDTSSAEYFKKINVAAQRISSMILFTKTYESIGAMAPFWQDIRALVTTAAKDAPLGNIVLENNLPGGTELYADQLIVKVFYNLMDNAARYGGKITKIRFSVVEDDSKKVIICDDDGNGIPDEEKEKIFERGFGKNTGLGLFLTREILNITGITILETGEQMKGARFEIRVPEKSFRNIGMP